MRSILEPALNDYVAMIWRKAEPQRRNAEHFGACSERVCLILLNHVDFQIVEVDHFYKIILRKTRLVMLFKILNGGF